MSKRANLISRTRTIHARLTPGSDRYLCRGGERYGDPVSEGTTDNPVTCKRCLARPGGAEGESEGVMTKLSENMTRALVAAIVKGGADEAFGRGVSSVEALERKELVKITHRVRMLTNGVFFEVTERGLEVAVDLETRGLLPRV